MNYHKYVFVSTPVTSDVTTPTLPSDVTTSTLTSDVATPTIPNNVTTPTVPSDVATPTLPSDMAMSTLPSDVTTSTVASDVATPTLPSDVTTPTLASDVTTPTLPPETRLTSCSEEPPPVSRDGAESMVRAIKKDPDVLNAEPATEPPRDVNDPTHDQVLPQFHSLTFGHVLQTKAHGNTLPVVLCYPPSLKLTSSEQW